MTLPYEWNPVPHVIDIVCTNCNKEATFEFAELVKIKEKKDIDFFKKSKKFEYMKCVDSCGHVWHGAMYYYKLNGSSTQTIVDLPEGYNNSDWNHSQYAYRSHGIDQGTIFCPNCSHIAKHILTWPNNLYFKIEYKSQFLWAYNRVTAAAVI